MDSMWFNGDGKNLNDAQFPGGLYFYQVKSGKFYSNEENVIIAIGPRGNPKTQ